MAGISLTARQQRILVAFVTEANTQVDWAKVAEKSNCKTAKYARDQFAGIRKALQASVGNGANVTNGAATNGDDAPETPKSKGTKTPGTGKRKKAQGETEDIPAKKKAARKSKSATPAAAETTTDDQDEEEEAKVKAEPNGAGELMDDML